MTNQYTREEIQELIQKTVPEQSKKHKKMLEESVYEILEKGASLKDALHLTPAMIEEIYRQAYNQFQAGKYKQAIQVFLFLCNVDSQNTRYYFALGAAYHYLKDYSNATTYYLICTTLDPINPIPHFHLYDCLMKTDFPLIALQSIITAIKLAELDPDKYGVLKTKAELEKQHLERYFKEQVINQTP